MVSRFFFRILGIPLVKFVICNTEPLKIFTGAKIWNSVIFSSIPRNTLHTAFCENAKNIQPQGYFDYGGIHCQVLQLNDNVTYPALHNNFTYVAQCTVERHIYCVSYAMNISHTARYIKYSLACSLVIHHSPLTQN